MSSTYTSLPARGQQSGYHYLLTPSPNLAHCLALRPVRAQTGWRNCSRLLKATRVERVLSPESSPSVRSSSSPFLPRKTRRSRSAPRRLPSGTDLGRTFLRDRARDAIRTHQYSRKGLTTVCLKPHLPTTPITLSHPPAFPSCPLWGISNPEYSRMIWLYETHQAIRSPAVKTMNPPRRQAGTLRLY
jgi:hypothetical protein